MSRPDIIHWKSAKKSKVDVGFGAKLVPNYVECCEKNKETVFLRDSKLKFCLKNSIFGTLGAKMWVLVRSKIAKKRLFLYQPPHSKPSFPEKSS